jgi:hypothetical protein
MKHNIIKTEKYLLAVDDSDIKQGDWFYCFQNNNVLKCFKKEGLLLNGYHTIYQKIAAHLPLNNSPILEGVPLLPPLEDGVEELAKEFATKPLNFSNPTGTITDLSLQLGFKSGYNKAKEKYKYTEEDLRKAIDMARNGNRKVIDTKGVEYLFILQEDKIIQSLQQPKMPVAFECEMKQKSVNGSIPVNQEWEYEPKKTTNPQGQAVLAGKYIFFNN